MTSHCETTRKGFSERFDDRLSSERRVQLDGHLAHCDPCRRAWAEYQTIFMAVRSMPGLHLDAPPPFPESAPSFVRPVQRKWSRGQVSAVAGLFLALIGVAGGLAFQLDRERKARGLQSPPLESAFLDTPKDVMLASMPDPAAGRVLSRAHNTMAVLGALSEFGSRRSGSEVLDVVTSGVDCLPIDDDADSLLQMNQEDLGRWQGEAQDFAQASRDWVTFVRDLKGRQDLDTPSKLRLVTRATRDRGIPAHLAGLGAVTEYFKPAPFSVRIGEDDPMGSVMRALALCIQDDREAARRIFVAPNTSIPLGSTRTLREFLNLVATPEGSTFVLPEQGGGMYLRFSFGSQADQDTLQTFMLRGGRLESRRYSKEGEVRHFRLRIQGQGNAPEASPEPLRPVKPLDRRF